MNIEKIIEVLQQFGLNKKETLSYIALLKTTSPTLLELSHLSGINRTTLYRIAEKLQNLGLVQVVLDQGRMRLKASDPENLKTLLKQRESEIDTLKSDLDELIRSLEEIKEKTYKSPSEVIYYKGISGLKQILWNTLVSRGEMIGYGYTDWNHSVGRSFAEKVRKEIVRRKIPTKEIRNEGRSSINSFTDIKDFGQFYKEKVIPKKVIEIKHDTYIYNDVFAFYHFIDNEMFGVEFHNPEIAKTQKQIFDFLWKHAKPRHYRK